MHQEKLKKKNLYNLARLFNLEIKFNNNKIERGILLPFVHLIQSDILINMKIKKINKKNQQIKKEHECVYNL